MSARSSNLQRFSGNGLTSDEFQVTAGFPPGQQLLVADAPLRGQGRRARQMAACLAQRFGRIDIHAADARAFPGVLLW